MAVLYVERESQPQKAQFVALTQKDKDGNQMIAGSDNGLIMVDINHQRLHEGRAFIACCWAWDNCSCDHCNGIVW